MTIATDIPPAVQALVGVPYVHGSADPAIGLDCLTLCGAVFDVLGRRFPAPGRYGRDSVHAGDLMAMRRWFEPCDPEPWAVVEIGRDHCGVLLPGAWDVIHADRRRGSVVVHRLAAFRDHVRGIHRLLEAPRP